jgi:glycosyltransferase involved in cell wall biosynthesis
MMTHPMHIGIASSGLGHVTRGIEAWASDLARALVARGQRVTLFKGAGAAEAEWEQVVPCWRRASRRAVELVRTLRRVLWRFGLGTEYGVEQVTFAAALLDRLASRRIDLLHVQDPQVALLVQLARRVGLARCPVILGHGTNEPPSFLRKIRYVQHLAPWHMEAARRAGAWRPTWTAIPNFIDTDRFAPDPPAVGLRAELSIPADATVVLSVAAIKETHKRVGHVIREVTSLRHASPSLPVWLVVAGGLDVETDSVVREGRALLGDHFRALTGFPRERMPDLYRAADLFVLGSLREMMPIALLEATATALPCVTHAHPSLDWIVGAGGVSIRMDEPGALADVLAHLLVDARRRRELGNAARQHCLRHFSRDRVLDRLVDYYRLVSSSAARRQLRLPIPIAA